MSKEPEAVYCYADAVKVSRKRHNVDGEEDPEECGQAILERLNEDCWRAVLDYVPIEDILTLEQLSPGWKDLVHSYLQGAGMCLVSIRDTFEHQDARMLKLQPKNRIKLMKFNGYNDEFREAMSFIEKWGQSIVYTYCRRGALMEIAKHCPNLISISIEMCGFGTGDLSPELVQFTEKLERIAFMDYACMDNLNDSMDLDDDDVYKSVFAYRDDHFASYFWRNFKPTNLKSITFRGGFDFRYFLSAVECYPNVTELSLQGGNKNIHLLFEKMPNLERLCIISVTGGSPDWNENVRESICSGLPCLKQFIVWESSINHCLPEVILTTRRGLQSLDIRFSDNIYFLDKLLQANGPTLTDVRLVNMYLTEEEMVTLVKSCPILASLDLRVWNELTDSTLAKIASVVQGRPSPLRVHLGGLQKNTYDKIVKAKFPELIVEVEPPLQYASLYLQTMRPRQYIWGIEDNRDYRDRWIKYI